MRIKKLRHIKTRTQIMDNFIYQPKPEKNTDHLNNNAYYCMVQTGDFIDEESQPRCEKEDDKRVCAKKIVRADGTIKYLVKLSEDRKLYNPVSIYDNKDSKNFLASISRNQNIFKEVNYRSFNMYLRFLKTKNMAYLNNAEREI